MQLLRRSNCSSWDDLLRQKFEFEIWKFPWFEKFLDMHFNIPCVWYIFNSFSLPPKETSYNSVTQSVHGILKPGNFEVFSNIYVLYGRAEYCWHVSQQVHICFQQKECITPLLILPKAFFILLTFYLCKLIIRKQDINFFKLQKVLK